MYKTIYQLLCSAYSMILRPLLVKAVDDPDEEWDDLVLAIIDGIFGYKVK